MIIKTCALLGESCEDMRKWENNIKIDMKGIDWEVWTGLMTESVDWLNDSE